MSPFASSSLPSLGRLGVSGRCLGGLGRCLVCRSVSNSNGGVGANSQSLAPGQTFNSSPPLSPHGTAYLSDSQSACRTTNSLDSFWDDSCSHQPHIRCPSGSTLLTIGSGVD
ncbi:unnamed protein product [Protopolystoma xenopodis]|uniref:Uncharacterized protein n=1 Tax=Protopolystoma xenopodis TaxID=117903 RepID=A0A3S5ARD0_9PLAT|nr:unnamed protein product [Protopolystoma xenopodis]